LRYFAVLGEELNYRRAAERLFITQPALSTAIKQLEHQFGVVLFNRNTREVALTDLGAAWLPQVHQAIAGVDAIVDNLVTLSGTRKGVLRLGYLIGTGADLLFRIVRHFESAYPDVTVEPIEFDFADPTAGLGDGRTDVALIRPPVDLPDHRMLMLDSESWVACLPRDHRLADRSEVVIAELLDDPIVCAPLTAARQPATHDRGRGGNLRGGDDVDRAGPRHQFHHVIGRPSLRPAGHCLRAHHRPAPELHGAGLEPRITLSAGGCAGQARAIAMEFRRGPRHGRAGCRLVTHS
jgi:DNA-binding transcriptional LysR family regulator